MKKYSIVLAALLALSAVTACQRKIEQPAPAPAAVEIKPAEETPTAVESGQPGQAEPDASGQKQ